MFHQPNHSHRPHDYEPRVREGTIRAYVIGIVVATATVFGAFMLLTSSDEQADPPLVQIPESPDSGERIEPLVEVSDTHAVYSLRESGLRFEMSQEVALRAVRAGGDGWQVCLVEDDGVVAVIGPADAADMLVVIEGIGVPDGRVSVPAGGGSIIGVEGVSGYVTITVFLEGEQVGKVSGPLTEH